MPGSKMALFFPMLFQRQKGSWQDKIPWGVVFLRSYNLAVEKYYEAAFHLRFSNSPFFSTQFFTFGRETRSRHFCWGYKRREEMDGNERISELNSSASSSPNICCLFLPSLSPHNRLLLPDRSFLNFGTLETAARRSWTTYEVSRSPDLEALKLRKGRSCPSSSSRSCCCSVDFFVFLFFPRNTVLLLRPRLL